MEANATLPLKSCVGLCQGDCVEMRIWEDACLYEYDTPQRV